MHVCLSKRKTAMVLFSAQRRMTDLTSTCEVYRLIYIVLCSKQDSEVVVQARQQLFAYATEEPCVELEKNENVGSNDNNNSFEEIQDTVHAT
jgi:hypothetical protein